MKGVAAYGAGRWVKILEDRRLGPVLLGRSNVNLKDKHRQLVAAGVIGEAAAASASQGRERLKFLPTRTDRADRTQPGVGGSSEGRRLIDKAGKDGANGGVKNGGCRDDADDNGDGGSDDDRVHDDVDDDDDDDDGGEGDGEGDGDGDEKEMAVDANDRETAGSRGRGRGRESSSEPAEECLGSSRKHQPKDNEKAKSRSSEGEFDGKVPLEHPVVSASKRVCLESGSISGHAAEAQAQAQAQAQATGVRHHPVAESVSRSRPGGIPGIPADSPNSSSSVSSGVPGAAWVGDKVAAARAPSRTFSTDVHGKRVLVSYRPLSEPERRAAKHAGLVQVAETTLCRGAPTQQSLETAFQGRHHKEQSPEEEEDRQQDREHGRGSTSSPVLDSPTSSVASASPNSASSDRIGDGAGASPLQGNGENAADDATAAADVDAALELASQPIERHQKGSSRSSGSNGSCNNDINNSNKSNTTNNDASEFSVQCIIKAEMAHGELLCLCAWKGFPLSEATWQSWEEIKRRQPSLELPRHLRF